MVKPVFPLPILPKRPYIRPDKPHGLGAKALTVAASLRCKEGLVLCTDSSITDWTDKYDEPKILTRASTAHRAFATTGAGYWDYVKMANELLIPRLLRNIAVENWDACKIVRDTVTEIYRNQIAAYPGPEKPHISMLVGVSERENGLYVIKATDTAVHLGRDFESIGTGAALARYISSKFFLHELTIHQSVALAGYIVHEAKRYIQDCGGNTYIVALTDEGHNSVSYSAVRSLDKWYEGLSSMPNLGKLPRKLQDVLEADVTT